MTISDLPEPVGASIICVCVFCLSLTILETISTIDSNWYSLNSKLELIFSKAHSLTWFSMMYGEIYKSFMIYE